MKTTLFLCSSAFIALAYFVDANWFARYEIYLWFKFTLIIIGFVLAVIENIVILVQFSNKQFSAEKKPIYFCLITLLIIIVISLMTCNSLTVYWINLLFMSTFILNTFSMVSLINISHELEE